MRLRSSQGQSLVETLFVLPVLVLVLSGVIAGLHSMGSYYLVDHWTYEASLCLAKNHDESECRRNLVKQLELIPLLSFRIDQLRRNPNLASVEVTVATPLVIDKSFSERLRLPLNQHDFRTAL